MFEGVTLPYIRPRSKNSCSKRKRLSALLLAGRMSYTLEVLLLHWFGSACRSNRRRLTIHYFVLSQVSSDADFKRSPLLAGGCSAGQGLACSSVEGQYATIPCLGLPGFRDGGRPLISLYKVRAGFPGRGGDPGHCVNIAFWIENEGVFLCISW